MAISCVAIEDEPPALEKLASFIKQVPWLILNAQFTNSIEAATYLQQNHIQLIFIDIQMDSLSGLQVLDTLNYRPGVIITTAFSEFALKGYEYSVKDYLLKPYSFERFLQAIGKIEQTEMTNVNLKGNNFIFVKSDYRIVKVEFEDIFYIEGMRDYRCIVTKQGKLMTPTTFSEFETLLPANLFPRIHKSYMVSLRKITSIEHQRVYISDAILPVGDNYKKAFFEILK